MGTKNEVTIRGLFADERLKAYQNAKDHIIAKQGEKPTRDDFSQGQVVGEWPQYVTKIMMRLTLIMLIATFTPSAIRIYQIGSQTFGDSVGHEWSKIIAGIACVLMSEVGMIIFSLALAIMPTSRTSKLILYSSIAISASFALIGNIQIAMPGHWNNPFAWLEAVAPPVLTLGTSYVMKEQMLYSIRQTQKIDIKYGEFIAAYRLLVANPEDHKDFLIAYANAIRDMIKQVNSTGRGAPERKQIMMRLTNASWSKLVKKEMESDNWFDVIPSVGKGKSDKNFTMLATLPGKTAPPQGNGKVHSQ